MERINRNHIQALFSIDGEIPFDFACMRGTYWVEKDEKNAQL